MRDSGAHPHTKNRKRRGAALAWVAAVQVNVGVLVGVVIVALLMVVQWAKGQQGAGPSWPALPASMLVGGVAGLISAALMCVAVALLRGWPARTVTVALAAVATSAPVLTGLLLLLVGKPLLAVLLLILGDLGVTQSGFMLVVTLLSVSLAAAAVTTWHRAAPK